METVLAYLGWAFAYGVVIFCGSAFFRGASR
jgi:hypothetical protein